MKKAPQGAGSQECAKGPGADRGTGRRCRLRDADSFVQSDSPPPVNEARQIKSKLLHLWRSV